MLAGAASLASAQEIKIAHANAGADGAAMVLIFIVIIIGGLGSVGGSMSHGCSAMHGGRSRQGAERPLNIRALSQIYM